MSEMKNMWARTGAAGRAGLLASVVLIALLVAGLGYWAMGKTYQPLFTDLAEQDAATLVAELDRMKVPYRLEAGGRRIVVPEDMVHKLRLQLVNKQLPLHGAVGFELFNNTDFGMTEFNQRVNYQRALQGELTRTIMSLEEVQSARVHLVLPESTLFKREQNKPKASVTVGVRTGQSLGREQVLGIQRLVAAAVPGIEMGDVTVLDLKGNTLSRRADAGSDLAGWQLQTKRDIEDMLAQKAGAVLDRAYGPGQGLVSVDVMLNFDQVKTTTEEVLGTKAGKDAAPSGVLVRERQTVKDLPQRSGKAGGNDANAADAAVTQTDMEYQTGRRVEQIVSSPGSVRRINVAVVLPKGVSGERAARVQQLVATAIGLDPRRGDAVAVQSIDKLSDGTARLVDVEGGADPAPARGKAVPASRPAAMNDIQRDLLLTLAAVLVGAAIAAAFLVTRRRAMVLAPAGGPLLLAEPDRQELLGKLQLWLAPGDAPQGEGRSA